MEIDWNEMIGYVAMAFVAISIAMKDLKKLRVFNLIGAICFVIYSMVGDKILYPVLILNALLAVLNTYHIFKLKSK